MYIMGFFFLNNSSYFYLFIYLHKNVTFKNIMSLEQLSA